MNSYELVAAVQYLLESRQAELLRSIKRKQTSAMAVNQMCEELHEIESIVEKTREGYTE